MVEPSLIVPKPFVTAVAEVRPYVEAEGMGLDVLLRHVLFVEENLLTVVVVPTTLVGVRQHLVGLLYCEEQCFGFLVALVLIGVVFESHLSVVL